ncbi:MAG: 4Fe-4S dicluster domain-containing protein [Clostridiales bacterium]|nr:4Fe-4S dicluster domain-containing protein [Clostridiales bacterium]
MKVAIVTIYDYFNHGNRLQNYALEKAISKFGYDVETLAVPPKKFYPFFFGMAGVFSFLPVTKRIKNSMKFTKQSLKSKTFCKYSKKNLEKTNGNYDCFVIGSDQVWNPKYIINNDVSFLKFVDAEKTVAYAPSFGIETVPEKYQKDFAEGLNHIKYLSSREKEGTEIIKTLTQKDAEVVVDPTVLLTKEEWESFAEPVKKLPEKYILTYFLGKSKAYREEVEKIAKENNLQVINLNAPFDKFHKSNPKQFMYLIKNAELVCSNSFHGNVLSIIMEKPFISFVPTHKTRSRIVHLLKNFGLEDRNFEILKKEEYFNADFSFSREKIEKQRAESLKYLEQSLNEVKTHRGGYKEKCYKDKKDCSGCYACASICPKGCIEMTYDEEGFWYPKINNLKCINCGLCKKICPVLNKKKKEESEPKAYAAYNKDLEVRLKSSSGGIFSVLAEKILDNGGVVFGVGFNKDFEVEHQAIENKEDLSKLRISKYVQSRIGNCFVQAKKFLDAGRQVLFTGTACQIAGLLSYLQKDYDNLFTQDIICHGVPSPLVWKNYVQYREEKAGAKTEQIIFRRKYSDNKKVHFYYKFENGNEHKTIYYRDPMLKLFFLNKCLRPSCHACSFKNKNRQADITLADFWGVKNVAPDMDDDKGTSLVIVHSQKGQQVFEGAKEKIEFKEVEFKKAIKKNPLMLRSARPFSRKSFMRDYKKKPFKKVIGRYGEQLF